MDVLNRPIKVLAALSDASSVEILNRDLPRQGFELCPAASGGEALSADGEAPDIIVLDWTSGDPGSAEVCRRLRARPELGGTPILMLTPAALESERIEALNSGADDCLTKPFSPLELLARMRVLLRRMNPGYRGRVLTFEDIEMDVLAHRVRRSGATVPLKPTDFRLLRYLLSNPGRVFSREQLLEAVWGNARGVDVRTVDHHVQSLRRALNARGRKDLIRTVRQVGYALDTEA